MEGNKYITYAEVKEPILKVIKSRYKSVSNFATSEEGLKICAELGIKPNYIQMYLTPKGDVNFSLMEYLYNLFGLGKLDKKVVVERKTHYFIK